MTTIPNKRYFTIGEVSSLCGIKPHVLRYWEQEFPQLKPVKRRGNRRYYQRRDVLLILQIRDLLYEQGFTIQGARQQLLSNSPLPESSPANDIISLSTNEPPDDKPTMLEVKEELEYLLSLLQND